MEEVNRQTIKAALGRAAETIHKNVRRPREIMNESNTSDFTIDGALETIQSMRELSARMRAFPDVILMTHEVEAELKRHVSVYPPDPHHDPVFDKFFGIPFESYPTMEQVDRRRVELASDGRLVQIVTMDNPPQV